MSQFWTQKGNPLSDQYTPKELKVESWDPENPEGK